MGLFLKKHMMKYKRHKKLSDVTQLQFLKRLYRLLEKGYPLIAALETISWDNSMRASAQKIIYRLKNGHHLDKAFDSVPFHKSITAYLYFVRVNGNLLISIKKSIIMFEHRMNYMSKFKQIMRYPILLLIIFVTLIIFIKRTILPSFNQLFQSQTASSKTVVYSIQIIDYFTSFILITSIVIFIISMLWFLFKNKLPMQTKIMIYSKIPFLRSFMKMQTSYYFAIHLSMLLKAGIPLQECLLIMNKQPKLPILSHYSSQLTEKLNRGQQVYAILTTFELFEEQFVVLFQKNSDIAALERDLSSYADLLAEQIEQKIMRIIMFIQPVFLVILAFSIIFIYIALMWPMFQLIKTI